ncbi:GntR family transcriptional regulator [Citricoccus sp. GCM10030269]|uniref:GntR family transcriptional regulator n=1 Tax=Citricoccus sp. GCM10030269 TaxID=3273388 RepID=UPI00360A4CB8
MSETGPIEVTNVGHEVLRRLRRMITSGRLQPGSVVTLRSIGEELGVSTTPVREALRVLQAEGLIKYDRRSVTVAQLSSDDVRELFAIRLRLEQLAAEWAIDRLTAADVADIEEILGQLDDAVESPERWRVLNQDFHRRFYDCAQSPRLLDYIARIWDSVEPYMAIYSSSMEAFHGANAEHRRMFEAIRDRDLETLLVLTTQHLDSTAELVIRELDRAAGR